MKIFEPLQAGNLYFKNRILLAPLTRCRCTGEDGRTPNELMAEYYAQRSGAGILFSEATSVDPMGVGYPNTPGIWSNAHVEGWEKVTRRVHEAGGQILLQLWHVGRVSDPLYLNGKKPVAPSAVAPSGYINLVRPRKTFETPRALELSEIPEIIEAYRRAAQNAKAAGFDGVEIHGANGYLLDQFLQDGTNRREDRYGGSIENRARLMLEVTDAVISVWGADRVGMHLAPRGDAHDMKDSNPLQTFSFAARELGKKKIAFLCVRESLGENRIGPALKKEFGGVYIANEGFTRETAEEVLEREEADAVAFGRLYIANPDLVERFKQNAPLNAPKPQSFYAPGPEGYTDYPFWNTAASV